MSSTPILLLFGAGANTGLATAEKFAKEGYKVAAVSNHPSAELKETAHLILPTEWTNPSSVETVFETVTKELGAPNVVIYNSYDVQIVSSTNPLTVSAARLSEILAVSTVAPYTAARLAVKGWETLPASAPKAFLFTGNMCLTQLWPATHSLGIAKNATAYFIEVAAAAYQKAGKRDYRFYYVDERSSTGESVMLGIDGEAHALEFWKLVHKIEEQSHWCWTFFKGDVAKGEDGTYLRVPGSVDREYRDLGMGDMPEGGVSYQEVVSRMKTGEAKWPEAEKQL